MQFSEAYFTLPINPVVPISSFREVEIRRKKPLVLCDIDDTVIGYDKTYDFFYKQLLTNAQTKNNAPAKMSSIFNITNNQNNDYELKHEAEQMYNYYRMLNNPKHCDYAGFIDLVERVKQIDGEVQFLTARSRESAFHTRNQFKEIGLNYDDYRVHYTGGAITKGMYISRYFNLNMYGEVLFIDDLDSFIHSVVSACPSVRCYKFNYIPS
jgi:hypothetical protein